MPPAQDRHDTPAPARNLILVIAALQGVALYALSRAFEHKLWPYGEPGWSVPLWAIALLMPLFAQLSATRTNGVALARVGAGLTLALGLLGTYIGQQMIVSDSNARTGTIALGFGVSVTIAVFIGLIFAQRGPLGGGESRDYATLFMLSWRNFLTGTLAGLFVLGVWLILLLWGGLFDVIGIDFFRTLFRESWFYIPVLSVAFGLGVLIFRSLDRIIDSITRLLEGLFRLLLPLIVALTIAFTGTLPFVGLQPLWDTGSGTFLLIALLAGLLFALNAVYQDGAGGVYPRPLAWAICLGVVVLPLIAALAGYGLWLRIAQHGLSVERCWGLLVWAFLSLFGVGYFWAVVRSRLGWIERLAQTNVALGIALAAVLTLTSTPLLDFRKLTLASQLARVESGTIDWYEFDACYVHSELGTPGQRLLAAQSAAGNIDQKHFDVRYCSMRGYRKAVPEERIRTFPPGTPIPAGLLQTINDSYRVGGASDYALVKIRLNSSDEQDDYVLLELEGNWAKARLYSRNTADASPAWIERSMRRKLYSEEGHAALLQALERGAYAAEPPEFRDFVIDGERYRVE
ncbi:MAG: hypothetical protein AAF515_17650 [Pseudomonadota bacterium]